MKIAPLPAAKKMVDCYWIAEVTGHHVQTIRRMAKQDPKFPRRIQTGKRNYRFYQDEVENYFASKQR